MGKENYIASTHTEMCDDGHGASLVNGDPYDTVLNACGAERLSNCGTGTGEVDGIEETANFHFFEDDEGGCHRLGVFSDGSWVLFSD